MSVVRCLVTLVLVGVAAAGLPAADEPTKKEFATATERLKAIGIGFHGYCDLNELRLLDDIADKDGRFVLSWRVALLPFVGEEKLFKQFKLDEPWDGPNNKKLIEKMPKVYAPARGKAKAGETFCQRFVGKDAIWNERGATVKLLEIADGTSNTALVVEAADPVIWTQPSDLSFNAKAPLPGLGGPFGGDFHVLTADGAVYLYKKGFDQDEMKKVIMPNDGQVIATDKLLKK